MLTSFNNGLLEKSEEAVFKNNVKTFLEDYKNVRLKKELKNQIKDVDAIEAFNKGSTDKNDQEDIKYWIPSITKDFIDRIFIQNGIFKADKTKYTENELVWLEEMGIEMGIAPVIGTTDMWQLDDTKTVITAYLGPWLYSKDDLSIPKKVKDVTTGEIYTIQEVSGIHNGNYMLLNSLTIASDLTFSLDVSKKLTPKKLFIGDNVTFNNSLDCQYYIEEVIMDNNITIKGSAFQNGVIKKITIGDNFYCTTGSFIYNNTKLTEVTIGDNATFGRGIFENKLLKTVNIGKDLSIINMPMTTQNILQNNSIDLVVNIGSFKSVVESAVSNCTMLEKIIIEDGGTIETNAFSGCTNVNEIILGNSTIASKSFAGCTGIEKVIIKNGNSGLTLTFALKELITYLYKSGRL